MTESPPAALSLRDEADLSWFFSRGESSFERSTSGAVLDKAKLFSQATATVEVDGQKRRLYPLPSWPRVRDGEIRYSEHEQTARPTAESRAHGGSEPEHETLVRYGVVSRRLQALERVSPIAVATLKRFFGDEGQKASLTKAGRISALFPLTEAGRKLLARDEERAKKSAELHVSTDERMRNLSEGQKTQAVREALARCERQAQQLLADACSQWRLVADARRVAR